MTSHSRFQALLFWASLLSLGLLLRLVGLEQLGIWQDEGLTLYQIRLPWDEILQNQIPVAVYQTQNTVPPLYFLFLGAWGRLVGFDLWALRLFGVFSILLVALCLYLVGRWIADRRVGRIAAVLATISPLYLWYAQELRMYSLLLIPATLSTGLLWRWYQDFQRQRRAWPWLGLWFLTATLMIMIHYLSALLIAAQVMWLVLQGMRRATWGFILVLAPIPFLVLLAFPRAWQFFTSNMMPRDFYRLSLDYILRDLLESFAVGLPRFQSVGMMSDYAAVAALLLLVVGGIECWRRGGWSLVALLGGTLLIPVVLLFGFSYFKPLYQNARHLIFVSPVFYLLWAAGFTRLARVRWWLPLPFVLLFTAAWLPATQHYFDPENAIKNDVRPLFEYLADHAAPGDVVALNDPVLQHAFEYLAPDVPWTILPPYGQPPDDGVLEVAYHQLKQDYERVWYVFGPPDTTFDTADAVLQWLRTNSSELRVVEFPGQTRVGASYFDFQHPTVQFDPYPIKVPAAVPFADGITYSGLYTPLPTTVRAGDITVLETVWQATVQPQREYSFAVELVDLRGTVWFQTQMPPLGGVHRTTHWLAGQWVRVPLFLELPRSLPPADYFVQLYLIDERGQVVGTGGSSDVLRLETPLTVASTAGTPEAPSTGVTVGRGVRLDVQQIPTQAAAGTRLPLTLSLTVLEPEFVPVYWLWSLRDAEGQTVSQHTTPWEEGLPRGEGDEFQNPEGGWQRGQKLALRYELPLPASAAGDYELLLSAGEEDGTLLAFDRGLIFPSSTTYSPGWITVPEREVRLTRPAIAVAVDETWSGVVTLVGYNSDPVRLVADQPFTLDFVWQAQTATQQPYKVFVHLYDEAGEQVAQADAFFDVPSVAWQAGEYVRSEHSFVGIPPGVYDLVAGLYHEESGQRLPLDERRDSAIVGILEVAP